MDALLELSSRGNYTVFQNQYKYFHMLSICGNSTRSVKPERDSDQETSRVIYSTIEILPLTVTDAK